VLSGFRIDLGYRFISFLFGALLAGLAHWVRRSHAHRRPAATAALATSMLGFAGYFLYTLVGINGPTVNSGVGPAHVSWYRGIGLVLSVVGCAACAIGAIVMRRTSPRA
jgi:ABC-type Mn2+/Zn2+ transport system permease subunit